MDQPSIDGINTFIISLEVARDLKVALSGLGGDEIFAGYDHFKKIQNYSAKNPNLISKALKKLDSIRPNSITKNYALWGVDEELSVNNLRSFKKSTKSILKINIEDKYIEKFQNLTSLHRISKAEIDNYMLNTLLRDCDAMSMAHSLEVRPVLLDHKIVEMVFALPDCFKIQAGTTKRILIDSVKDIVPRKSLSEKKIFEMPFLDWMRGELKGYFREALNHQSAKDTSSAIFKNAQYS